jgi:hypothetical protein
MQLAAFVLLVAGFVAAIVLAVVPTVPRWLSAGVAGVVVLEAVWLLVLAAAPDPYFGSGAVSRWDFAETSGAHWLVVVALGAAALTVGGFIRGISSDERALRRAAAAGAAATFLLVIVAQLGLTVGH